MQMRMVAVILLFLTISGFVVAAVGLPADAPDFPTSLERYNDQKLDSIFAILGNRIQQQPFNLVASLIFLCAIAQIQIRNAGTAFCQYLRGRDPDQLCCTAGAHGGSALAVGLRLHVDPFRMEGRFGHPGGQPVLFYRFPRRVEPASGNLCHAKSQG